MEKLLELVKKSEEFQQYVRIVERYRDLPIINDYRIMKNYDKDCLTAMLKCATIIENDDDIVISLNYLIGKEFELGTYIGTAKYNGSIKKVGEDIVLDEEVDASFNQFDSKTCDYSEINKEIHEPLILSLKTTKYKGFGYLYLSKIR